MNFQRKLKLLLIGIDSLAVSVSWIAAYWIRHFLGEGPLNNPLNPFEAYLYATPLIVGLWVATNASFGLYTRRRGITRIDELNLLIRSSWVGLLVIASLAFLLKELDLARAVVITSTLLNLAFMGFGHTLFRRYEASLRTSGEADVRTLIVGAGMVGARALQKIQDHPEVGYAIVGFLDDDPAKADRAIGRARVLGTRKDFKRIVEQERIDEVIIAIPSMPHEEILGLVMEVETLDVRFRIVSDLFGVLAHETKIDLIEDIPIFDLKSGKADTQYEVMKRTLDLLLCVLALPVLVLAHGILSLAIRLDSPGPAIFTQERVGRYRKNFKMYKYRTMYSDTPKYAVAPKTGADPRITRLGKILRATSLDELPNLMNVIVGDMSLVGPRPEMPFIVDTYEEWQLKRLDVKPGVTGLWQILGRKDLPLHENLEYDFYYIKNRSLSLDLSILLKTFTVVISRKGAY
jgi:exopolysaccharide biosynthesis polyprenyl glycosylphosphotransferase